MPRSNNKPLQPLVRLFSGALVLVAAAGMLVANSSAAKGVAGQFDYYILSLSWSPQFCATKAGRSSPEQCGRGRHYGLVLHGLWPQYARGWPSFCAAGPADVPTAVLNGALVATPDTDLVEHEWDKHGKCSGLGVADYFSAAATQFAKISVPSELKRARKPSRLPQARLKSLFLTANPALIEDSVVLQCQGSAFSEIRVCLDKSFQPRPCGRDVNASRCRASTLKIVPIP